MKNKLSGTASVSNTQLETMLLSHNTLSGTLVSDIAELSSIQYWYKTSASPASSLQRCQLP